jgi:phosphoenolpyruvate carboxykinase (GTP)
LNVTPEEMAELLKVDKEGWLAEIESIKENYKIYGDKLPAVLAEELEKLKKALA